MKRRRAWAGAGKILPHFVKPVTGPPRREVSKGGSRAIGSELKTAPHRHDAPVVVDHIALEPSLEVLKGL
jgi:hypothetical protein